MVSKGKVKGILKWKSPTSLVEVQQFLGFANCYRRFIASCPSTELKSRFTSAPMLAHLDPKRLEAGPLSVE